VSEHENTSVIARLRQHSADEYVAPTRGLTGFAAGAAKHQFMASEEPHKGERGSDQARLAVAGSFCWNPDCPEYAQVGHHNIRKFGQTARGAQRYQCKACKKTFTETKGTVFYGFHHSQQTILDCLAMLADRNSLAAIHRIKGVKEETVCEWLQRAARHVEEIEALLVANYPVSRVQLDALWTYVGNKGEKGGIAKKRPEAASGEVGLLP
jgi:transposase-like protein